MLNRHEVLDLYFLDCRCMLLELAATLDRYDRASPAAASAPPAPAPSAATDERLGLLRQAIAIVAQPDASPDRAERMLRLFSDPA